MASAANTPYRRTSELTHFDIQSTLDEAGWNAADFARFTGLGYTTVASYLTSAADGKIPVLVEIALEYVERFPLELLARPEVQTPVRQTPSRKRALADLALRTAGVDAEGKNVGV